MTLAGRVPRAAIATVQYDAAFLARSALPTIRSPSAVSMVCRQLNAASRVRVWCRSSASDLAGASWSARSGQPGGGGVSGALARPGQRNAVWRAHSTRTFFEANSERMAERTMSTCGCTAAALAAARVSALISCQPASTRAVAGVRSSSSSDGSAPRATSGAAGPAPAAAGAGTAGPAPTRPIATVKTWSTRPRSTCTDRAGAQTSTAASAATAPYIVTRPAHLPRPYVSPERAHAARFSSRRPCLKLGHSLGRRRHRRGARDGGEQGRQQALNGDGGRLSERAEDPGRRLADGVGGVPACQRRRLDTGALTVPASPTQPPHQSSRHLSLLRTCAIAQNVRGRPRPTRRARERGCPAR